MFFSVYLHCYLRLSYFSLLFFGTLYSDEYIFSFLICFALLFSAICKAFSDNHFDFLHFYFMGIVLITTSCTMLQTSVYCSSGALSTRSNPLTLFVTSTVYTYIYIHMYTYIYIHTYMYMYIYKGFYVGHT